MGSSKPWLQLIVLLFSFCWAGGMAEKKQQKANFKNLSNRRADVHWDDGMWGQLIGSVDPEEVMSIGTYDGHKFWFTAHGVGSMLTHSATPTSPKTPAKITIQASQTDYELLHYTEVQSGACLDRFGACAEQSTYRQCTDNPGWMIVNCPASCAKHINVNGMDACTLQDPSARCQHSTMGSIQSRSLSGKGQLNTRFEHILTNFHEFSPKVLSGPQGHAMIEAQCAESGKCSAMPDGPWIVAFENFIRDEEIEALLSEAESIGFERSTEQGAMTDSGEQEKTLSQARTSRNTWCTGSCAANPLVKQISQRVATITQTPLHNSESFQVLSYEKGQYYRAHQDDHGDDGDMAGPRIMTLFMYLSDVEEGGETHFPRVQGGLKVKPRRGSAILWANVLNSDPKIADSRTLHEAVPVIRGQKYAANAWIHNDNYELPNKWGCTGSFS